MDKRQLDQFREALASALFCFVEYGDDRPYVMVMHSQGLAVPIYEDLRAIEILISAKAAQYLPVAVREKAKLRLNDLLLSLVDWKEIAPPVPAEKKPLTIYDQYLNSAYHLANPN